MEYHGARYIQVDTPCTSVWGFPTDKTMEVARLGINCGLVPIVDMEYGKVTSVRQIRKKVPVTEYLAAQDRYKHLLRDERVEAIAEIQALADANIEKYGLAG